MLRVSRKSFDSGYGASFPPHFFANCLPGFNLLSVEIAPLQEQEVVFSSHKCCNIQERQTENLYLLTPPESNGAREPLVSCKQISEESL